MLEQHRQFLWEISVMKTSKQMILYCLFVISILAVLPACGRKKNGIEILQEKGISINYSDTENGSKRIEDLVSFWHDLPKVENEISLEFNEESSVEFYMNLLDSSFNKMDYGNAYGLTNYLCKKYGLCNVEDANLGEITENELYILDLSEPLFDERISDSCTVEKAKANSVYFTEYVLQKYGIEKLVDITLNPEINEIVELKNEWLHSLGHEYEYERCATVRLVHNEEDSDEYPYYYEGDTYTIYFAMDDIKKFGYQTFFGDFSRISNIIDADFYDARKSFWKTSDDVERVKIYTGFSQDNSYGYLKTGGMYYQVGNFIRLYSDWNTTEMVLVHEYIHYLDKKLIKQPEIDVIMKRALCEALAAEVSTYECKNTLMKDGLIRSVGMERLIQLGAVNNGEVDIELITEIAAQKFFLSKSTEVVSALGDINIVTSEIIPWNYLPAQVNGCFLHFLMEKYGKEKIVELSYDSKAFDEFVSADYENLFLEWKEAVLTLDVQ